LGYKFNAPGRGVFSVGPAQIVLPGPLGLVASRYQTAPGVELLVAPSLVDLPLLLPDAESDLPQVRTMAGAERVTEPAAVRDYQSGDPRRLVHWKATARRDRLMVREVVLRGLPQAWVLVDDRARPGPAAERSLSISASAARLLLRSGHTVQLVYLGGAVPPERFEPAGGTDRLLESFARIKLGGTPDDRARSAPAARSGPLTAAGSARSSGRVFTQVLGQIGGRGAFAAIYGALSEPSEETVAELAPLAAVAKPGQLWLAGDPGTIEPAERALRRQGWTVERAA
jgi:uncharacterized protein (DUF58 family)